VVDSTVPDKIGVRIMTEIHRFAVPLPMIVGGGAHAELPAILRKLGVERPLVVTDRGLRDVGIVDTVLAPFAGSIPDSRVFDGVTPNPRESDVDAATAAYRSFDADGIVALGGGSAIDTAKATRILVSHPGKLRDFDLTRGGMRRLTGSLPSLVAIPTTAGTGSEVSRGALIITEEDGRRRKTVVGGPPLAPSWAVLDPELTVSLSPFLTAATGIDAISHAIEELCSPVWHPVIESIALGALRSAATQLRKAFERPRDLGARQEMMMAAMAGGIGFEKGLGAVHSLSHAIGAVADANHGALNAVLLPHVLRFNRDCLPRAAAIDMAASIGYEADRPEEAGDFVADWIEDLVRALGLPSRLRELGVARELRESVIALALVDHCHRTNPRACGAGEFGDLWDAAW
jgi:4-hydroxybutyrate dehydrogenase